MLYKAGDRIYDWCLGYGTVRKVNARGDHMTVKFDKMHGTDFMNSDSKRIKKVDLYSEEELKEWSEKMWSRVRENVQ